VEPSSLAASNPEGLSHVTGHGPRAWTNREAVKRRGCRGPTPYVCISLSFFLSPIYYTHIYICVCLSPSPSPYIYIYILHMYITIPLHSSSLSLIITPPAGASHCLLLLLTVANATVGHVVGLYIYQLAISRYQLCRAVENHPAGSFESTAKGRPVSVPRDRIYLVQMACSPMFCLANLSHLTLSIETCKPRQSL
jgi:hypothetical protein